MKPVIDYYEANHDMAGLIESAGVSLESDFTSIERESLRQYLENYLYRHMNDRIKIDMKKFYLQIKGADEVSNLQRLL